MTFAEELASKTVNPAETTRQTWTVTDTLTGEKYGTYDQHYYAEIEVGQIRGKLPMDDVSKVGVRKYLARCDDIQILPN